jgi:tripartite-type tricarboxylate transporter receptor subunit TctC
MIKTYLNAAMIIGLVLILGAAPALAGEFPEKPIQLLIPFGAGGSADLLGRAIANAAEKHLGQPVVAVNKPGGGGAVMYTALNNAKPDGYTVGWSSSGLMTVTAIGNVPFKYTAFNNLCRVGYSAMPIAVLSSSPWKTFKELVEYAKKNPGKIKIGNAGTGSGTHLTAAMAMSAADATVVHVPLGAKRRVPSLLGGEVEAICVPLPEAAPQVLAGKVRILAMSTVQRDAKFKEVPTFKELGYDVEMDLFRGIAVPNAVPAAVASKLTEAFVKAAEDAVFKDISDKKSFNISTMTGAPFSEYLKKMDIHVTNAMETAGVKK